MLMEEALNNTGWTSADAERIFLLQIRPAMCGSAFTGAYRHHHRSTDCSVIHHARSNNYTTPSSCPSSEHEQG